MKIREATINDKEKWNSFVRTNQGGSFMQSWEWGDFLSAVKPLVWRLIVGENEKAAAGADNAAENWRAVITVFKQDMKLGQSALYAPRGPVVNDQIPLTKDCFRLIVDKISSLAKRERALTFELDPETGDQSWLPILAEFDFGKTELDMQPRHTLILDIRQDEEELLRQMHQKTRYNLGLAQKKRVAVAVDNSAFKEFYDLLKKTMRRQRVVFFSQDYFKKILAVPFVKLYLARLNGQVIAANIMVFWNRTATYLFGASDYDYRQIMAPHLLQWQAIKDAKGEGMWFYDFWGAAPRHGGSGREENWSGFTKFKMGFSPEADIIEYIGTYEKVYSPVTLGLYKYLRKIFK